MDRVESLGKYLLIRSEKTPNKPAFSYTESNKWVTKSWIELRQKIQNISFALLSLGVKRGDRVGILSTTRYEICVCDLAISCIGALSVPLYPETLAEDCRHILSDADISFLFVENVKQLEKIKIIRKSLKNLHGVCLFSREDYVTHVGTFAKFYRNTLYYNELISLGEKEPSNTDERFNKMVKGIDPNDSYSVTYTSGTTGKPKGVVVTHRAAIVNVLKLAKEFHLDYRDTTLPVLPYAGIMGRMEFIFALITGAHSYYFKDIKKWKNYLVKMKPSLLFCTPYMLERDYYSMQEVIARKSKFRRRLIKRVVAFCIRVNRRQKETGRISLYNRMKRWILGKAILRNVAVLFGGKLRYIIIGGGFVNSKMLEFYSALGIPAVNTYALKETFSLVSASNPGVYKFDPVGAMLDGVDCRIADDGEIHLRGDGIFSEYYKNEKLTKESFLGDWFKTGDIGRLDNMVLTVKGRREDIVTLSTGEKVYPEVLETYYGFDRYIKQILLCGEGRRYMSAIIVPDKERVMAYARSQNSYYADTELLYSSDLVDSLMKERIATYNSRLKSYQAVRRFSILHHNFTIEAGELTSSLKLKRKFCLEKYQPEFDKLY
jgi:long-chain acyl-CoA synthetase